MHVRGVAFQAREALMVATHGLLEWRDFVRTFADQEPVFRQPIEADTLIPAEAFLELNDALRDHFYGGDDRSYWTFGERSAAWALSEGNVKDRFGPGELRQFLDYTPELWRAYFDDGRVELYSNDDGTIDVAILSPIRHLYFEYTVAGFAAGGLKHVGARRPEPQCLRGYSKGDHDVLYRFRID